MPNSFVSVFPRRRKSGLCWARVSVSSAKKSKTRFLCLTAICRTFRFPPRRGTSGSSFSARSAESRLCACRGDCIITRARAFRHSSAGARHAPLGVETLILTNAAGGINPSFSVGDIMLISDHINFMGVNPLVGPNDDTFGCRFPDMSFAYAPKLRELAKACAEETGTALQEGVYLACSGPSYETPAEIRAFRTLGADAVGMSTVPEVIAANHCGMQVLAFSLISNMAAGILKQKLTEEEVLEAGRKKAPKCRCSFRKLLKSFHNGETNQMDKMQGRPFGLTAQATGF